MPGTVKLKLGNMFDGPSDLVVLPCSAAGTVTDFVARTLHAYHIPRPRLQMELGQVDILPFEGGENIAQYVAFASSVALMESSPRAIRSIGEALGEFARQEPAVRAIAAPLLGTGAGGLESEVVVDELRRGFTSTAPVDAVLTIHILRRNVFDRFRKTAALQTTERPLRVFISHTSTTDEERSWVGGLGTFLRENGIEARLDRWHLRRGMDLPQWMTNELTLADRVIVVSTEAYKRKADGREGGVGWETMIIQGEMTRQPPESTKFQVVVRAPKLDDGLPNYLKTKYVFHCPPGQKDGRFRPDLLHELRGGSTAPPIGEPPITL